jgi:uncharacterized heparinase superfamily protein
MWNQARRYWRTLRHLKPQQITGRLLARAKRKIGVGRDVEVPSELQSELAPSVSFPEHSTKNEEPDLKKGTFQFLNEGRTLRRPIDWDPEASALWRFHLHYFQYLPDLSEALRRELCREWISANPAGQQPAWHPYPTSLRIINWCKAAPREAQILTSLYEQAAYLYRHLETYLLGNHLLENARALIYASHFFGDQGEAPEWGKQGLEIYRTQTSEQILPDGGHFERSPMYHALMLEGYLDVLNLLGPIEENEKLSGHLVDTARRMTGFLVALTHPDGQFAQFNDTVRGEAVSTSRLVAYAQEVLEYEQFPTSTSFEETGYYVYEDEDVYFVIDGGSIGPDYLPGHAHADIFSYELSIDRNRWIVDTGVSTYESGSDRRYERGTAAHNTVTVDGADQAECWGSFRVARRFPPSDVSYKHAEDGASFQGCFDGYASLLGDDITYERRVFIDALGQAIRVEDLVTGRGHHCIESRIHLHPDVKVEAREADSIQLSRGEHLVHVSVDQGNLLLDTGWHAPEFGMRKETHVLVIKLSEELPVTCSYVIRY